MMTRRLSAILFVALSTQAVALKQSTGLQEAVSGHAQSRTRSPRTVTPWLAWQVFHESLQQYVETSNAAIVDRVLTHRFGLEPGAASTVRALGSEYLSAMAGEDAASTAEVQVRYTSPGPAMPATPPAARPGAIYLPKNTTLLALAQGDRLFERAEAKKSALLNLHLGRLRASVGQRQVVDIERWVNDTVTKTDFVPDGGDEDTSAAADGICSIWVRQRSQSEEVGRYDHVNKALAVHYRLDVESAP